MRSDQQLLLRYREHQDQDALNTLFGRHYPSVYQVVRRLVADEFEARDFTQAAFLKALDALSRDHRPERFRAWLLTIAVNEVRQGRRRPQPRQTDDPLFEMFAEIASESTERAAQRAEFEQALEKALAAMPDKLREPLVLHYYQELPLAEIGAILGCSKSTVQNRLASAIRMLRKRFQSQGHAGLLVLLPTFFPAFEKVATGNVLTVAHHYLLGIGGLLMSHSKIALGTGIVALGWLLATFGLDGASAPSDGVDSTSTSALVAGRQVDPPEATNTTRESLPEATQPAAGRARVIDAGTGRPITRFRIAALRQTQPRWFEGARVPRWSNWFDVKSHLDAGMTFQDVQTDDGAFDLPAPAKDKFGPHEAWIIVAPGYAMLLAVGAPRRIHNPVLALHPIRHRFVQVLDHETETPVAGARLLLHQELRIDYVHALTRNHSGNSLLSIPAGADTGIATDLEGRARVPLLMTAAIFTDSAKPERAWTVTPGPFMVQKPGYAFSELTTDLLESQDTALLYLDRQSASLQVTVVDASGQPVQAALTLTTPSRAELESDAITDPTGRCLLHGLPAGPAQLSISLPKQVPEDLPPNTLLPTETASRLAAGPDQDVRSIRLVAGETLRLQHRMGSPPTAPPRAIVHGSVEARPDARFIAVQSRGMRGYNWSAVRGTSYQVHVKPDEPAELIAVLFRGDDLPQIEQRYRLPAIGPGQRHRVDLRPHPTHDLRQLTVRLRVTAPKDAPRPTSIIARLIRPMDASVRTPSQVLFDAAEAVVDGATRSCKLTPGEYAIEGYYRTSKTSMSAAILGSVQIAASENETTIPVPWHSRLVVTAKNLDGSPLDLRPGQSAYFVRSTDQSNVLPRKTFLKPGRYVVDYIAEGYRPMRKHIDIQQTRTTELEFALTPGTGAALSGKVVDAKTGRPLSGTGTISCDPAGNIYGGLRRQLDMGRFTIRGLTAGKYELRVRMEGTGESDQFVPVFHVELGEHEQRRGLVLKLNR